jgi:hypothetical protein
MAAIANLFDNVLLKCPIREIFVLSFFLGFDDVTGKMATNMFHAFVPTALAFEDSATETASASTGRLSLLHPATVADFLKAFLKGSPILGIGMVGWRWERG